MDDDLNSSPALAVLLEFAKRHRALANRLDRGDATAIGPSEAKLHALIEQRPVARSSKDLRQPIRSAHSCWSAATN